MTNYRNQIKKIYQEYCKEAKINFTENYFNDFLEFL